MTWWYSMRFKLSSNTVRALFMHTLRAPWPMGTMFAEVGPGVQTTAKSCVARIDEETIGGRPDGGGVVHDLGIELTAHLHEPLLLIMGLFEGTV